MASVSRSGADYYDVQIGFWTNWSHGKIQGSTLTITRRDGNLLVAFVALFVAASGKSLWRLLCFLLHRYLSSPVPQDGLYHQRQAILRNAATPEDGSFRLLQVLWVWRKRARRPFLRVLPIAVSGMAMGIAFIVGGVFSAQLTSDQGSEVLISGTNCGPLEALPDDTLANTVYLQPYLAQKATAHVNYALQCYSNATNSEDCNLYVKPKIPLTVERNASCPFAEKMCKSQNENIRVDTGYINSHHDLGINAPENERYEMRFVYECAPIVSEGFKRVYRGKRNGSIPEVVQYYYGNLTFADSQDEEYDGFTYEVFRDFSSQALPAYARAASSRPEFQLGAVVYFGGDVPRGVDVSEFQPIPELQRDDADVALLFLGSQGLSFLEPVDDPWYSAHADGSPLSVAGSNFTKPTFAADEPASAIGCVQQFTMCNPNKPKPESCEPLLGINAMGLGEGRWSAEQDAAIRWTGRAMMSGLYPISNMARLIGSSILLGRYNAMFGAVGSVPSNQWQLDVEHMIGASLASLQGSFVQIADGAPSEELKQFLSPPEGDMAHKMCKNQKILSTRYSSFFVLGLALILFIGATFIILDMTLEPLINWYQTRKARAGKLATHNFMGNIHSRLEWRATSIPQLQRLAHAAVGSGTWFNTADETPVTLPYEKLGVLDVRNTERPVYRPISVEDISCPPTATSTVGSAEEKDGGLKKEATVTENVASSPLPPTQGIAQMRRVRTGLSDSTLIEEISPLDAEIPDWRKLGRE